MIPKTKTEWKALAIEFAAAGVAIAFVGGCFAIGFMAISRITSCLVGGV